MKRLLAGIVSLAVFSATGAAESIGAALDRPAVAVRAPERAVLLAATQVGAQWVAIGEHGLVLRSDDGASR